MTRGMAKYPLASLCLLSLMLPGLAQAEISGWALVIDGDTIEVAAQRIRLHGIDAPELRQTCWEKNEEFMCGQNIRSALALIIGRGPVSCRERSRDRYRRIVAVCFTSDGLDIGRIMVRNGYALAYRKYSADYVLEERGARSRKAGLWGYRFTPPWDWRKMIRDAK